MALRERGDELGEDSIRYRDAVIQVLQKVQQFMRVGKVDDENTSLDLKCLRVKFHACFHPWNYPEEPDQNTLAELDHEHIVDSYVSW